MKRRRTTITIREKHFRLLKTLPLPISTFFELFLEEFFKKASVDDLIKAYLESGEEGVKAYIHKILNMHTETRNVSKTDMQEHKAEMEEKPKKKKSINDMFEGFI